MTPGRSVTKALPLQDVIPGCGQEEDMTSPAAVRPLEPDPDAPPPLEPGRELPIPDDPGELDDPDVLPPAPVEPSPMVEPPVEPGREPEPA